MTEMLKNKRIIALVILLISAISYQIIALATYPVPVYYNTEADCRLCHGVAVNRHHLLVPNGTYNCINCHAVKWSVENQTYYPEVIRDCLVCHPGKNHTDTHHLFVQQGLYVCSDCHQIKWDNATQSYYPEVTWNCTVCHSTVLNLNDTAPPGSISSLSNITYATTNINWTWTDPQDADLKEVLIYINGTYAAGVSKGVQYYNGSSLIENTEYTISTQTMDVSGNINQTWINHTAWTAPSDTIPPGSISSLSNITYAPTNINWTWIDPQDPDLKEVLIFINGIYITNVSKGIQYYNASSLTENTEYTISTQTMDASGNTNQTWINHTAWTASSDTTPPGSISSLSNITYAPTNINWTWIDPQDADLKEVLIYINGTYTAGVSKGMQYYNASSLIENTDYTISTQTMDASGNINQTWINHTARTSLTNTEPTPTPSPSPTPPLYAPTGLHSSVECSTCHASGKTEENICYQCHNDSRNSYNGVNISYQFNARNDTFAGLGIYNTINTRHDISDVDQNYSSTHLECTNCHGPHIADRQNITIDPDTKAPYNNTTIHPGNNETIADSITFCLKCHDNTWAPNVTGPSIITNISDVYTDPSIYGDEHGAASGIGNSRLIGKYQSRGRSGNVPPIPCTDCHDPHGGKGIYHLKTLKDQRGKNYTITSQNINKHDVVHWCSNCHFNPMNQLSGKKGNCLNSGCHIHGRKY